MRLTAFKEIKKVCSVGSVKHQFRKSNCNRWQGKNEQKANNESHPGENWKSHHGHARRPHVDDGGYTMCTMTAFELDGSKSSQTTTTINKTKT